MGAVKVRMANIQPNKADDPMKATFNLELVNEDNLPVTFELDVFTLLMLFMSARSSVTSAANAAKAANPGMFGGDQ